MPFNSPGFLLLLLPTVVAYYLFSGIRWQHFVLTAASLVFYWFAGVRDLIVLLSTIALNYGLASLEPRLAAILATVLNLSILAFFKYRNFLAVTVLGFPSVFGGRLEIPLGISFYVFQLIAYQVDRYRGLVQREGSFLKLLLYVLFFPHHQAGPIMRPGAFLPQFHIPKRFDRSLFLNGVAWTVYGLVLKVIADQVAVFVNKAFAQPATSAGGAWLAALGFAVQIYGDFAGYSNIAVGCGLLFGFRLDRNFNQPYVATSPSEFWERWHITLSAWLRDYLYIPLGGNRRGVSRTYVNLMTTMLLGGLWHGASWNFVLWGGLHGAMLCLYRAFPVQRWSRAVSTLIFQMFVIVAWIPFRCVSFAQTATHWRAMLGIGVGATSAREWLLLSATAFVFYSLHWLENRALGSPSSARATQRNWHRIPAPLRGALAGAVFLMCGIFLRVGTTFIYFRF